MRVTFGLFSVIFIESETEPPPPSEVGFISIWYSDLWLTGPSQISQRAQQARGVLLRAGMLHFVPLRAFRFRRRSNVQRWGDFWSLIIGRCGWITAQQARIQSWKHVRLGEYPVLDIVPVKFIFLIQFLGPNVNWVPGLNQSATDFINHSFLYFDCFLLDHDGFLGSDGFNFQLYQSVKFVSVHSTNLWFYYNVELLRHNL